MQTATQGSAVVERRIAITIDDLPWQSLGEPQVGDYTDWHRKLIAQMKQTDAPITGFVNEKGQEVDGEVDPARLALLEDWLDADFDLGNHTYAHQSLHDIGVPAFQQSILDGERQLRPLMAKRAKAPRWFRHPYLRTGTIAAGKQVTETFLGEHGYRVAPITVDNSEWIYAAACRQVLAIHLPEAERDATLKRLRQAYAPYMLNKLDYYERQPINLLGYALP